MNLLRGSLLTLGMCLIGYTGFGQEKKDTVAAKTDTLKLSVAKAQQFALENNRTVKSSKLDIESAKKKVWETTAIGLPQFTASADYQHLFTIPELSFGGSTSLNVNQSIQNPDAITANMIRTGQVGLSFTPFPPAKMGVADNITYTFTLSQLIFSGEYIVGLQASRIYKELSEKSSVKTEQTTIESVANGYYLVLVLDENINVLKESMKVVEKTYADLSGMNKQGFAESSDVDQMKINKANIQTMINSLSSQRDVAMKLLQLQLGIDFSKPVVLSDSLSGIIKADNNLGAVSSNFDINSSVDYQLALTQEGLMSLSLRREKSKFLPTISAYYRHQEYMKEPPINFQPKDVLGASLNIPIFTSGSRISKVGQAKIDLQKATLAKENANQALTMEFERAKNDYITAYNNFTNNKESMELSNSIYNKNIIKFKEGVGTSLELTQSQNQFLTAESNYYNSVLSLLNAKAKLDRILSKYEKPN
jgi:outer membrane protein TolC